MGPNAQCGLLVEWFAPRLDRSRNRMFNTQETATRALEAVSQPSASSTAGEWRDTLPSPNGGVPWDELRIALALNNDVAETDGEPIGEQTELALYEAATAGIFAHGM